MKILVTGGSGFIGRVLCRQLMADDHELVVLSRKPENLPRGVQGIASIDELTGDEAFSVLINLAGEPIADRPWTGGRRAVLRASRIELTHQLFNYVERCSEKPSLLISASAIGYYGDQGDHVLDEASDAVNDFAHQLCRDWEYEARRFEDLGVGVCILRIGLVLGSDGGFLQRMLLPFRLGLGGPLGNGNQWMSWVHRDDVVGIICFLMEHQVLRGVFNATAPEPVTNSVFSTTLAECLHRPAFFRVPALFLKTALGEMSSLLLGSQRVQPKQLQQAGYRFKFRSLDEALKNVLSLS